jgi:prophage regulatory protein
MSDQKKVREMIDTEQVLAVESARPMLVLSQVLRIVPVGRTTLFRMERDGRFPPSYLVSPNRRAWFEDEVIAWQKALKQGRRATRNALGRGAGRV